MRRKECRRRAFYILQFRIVQNKEKSFPTHISVDEVMSSSFRDLFLTLNMTFENHYFGFNEIIENFHMLEPN